MTLEARLFNRLQSKRSLTMRHGGEYVSLILELIKWLRKQADSPERSELIKRMANQIPYAILHDKMNTRQITMSEYTALLSDQRKADLRRVE